MSTGPLFVLTTLMLKRVVKVEVVKKYISRVVLSIIAVPALGSSIGGTLAYLGYWRLLFHLDALIIACAILVVYWVWRDFYFEKEDIPFDFVGYGAYAIGISSLFCFAIFGQQLDWFRSPLLVGLFILGVIAFTFFVVWSIRHKYPLLKIYMLRDLGFVAIILQLGGFFAAYYGMVVLLSLWLKLYVNYSVAWINVVMGTMAITAFVVMWAIAQARAERKWSMLLLATVLLATSCMYTATFNAEVNLFRIGLSRVIAGVGIALFLPPLFYSVVSRFEDGPSAMTWYQVTKASGTAMGVCIYTTVWQRRDSFFHERLGSQLTAFSEKVDGFYEKLATFDLSPMQRVELLGETLGRQAQALALDDCFFLMGWVTIGLGFLCVGHMLHVFYRTVKRTKSLK